MILRRLLAAAAAIGAALAAAAALVVALVYALFAFVRGYIGPAGAAGVVALVIALLFGVVVLVMAAKAGGDKSKSKAAGAAKVRGEAVQPLDRVLELARDRPIVAAAGAVAAGLVALRNPTLIGLITRAVVEPKTLKRS